MTCIRPPELEEATLLAYLDEEENGEIADHLRDCNHCRARADALASFEAGMRTALYRIDCPTPLTLAEHRAGLISGELGTAITAHLEICPHCRAEAGQLEGFLSVVQPDLEVSTLDRVKVIVGRLIQGGRREPGPALRPALAGVRGSGDGPMIFEGGDIRIAMDVEPDPESPGRRVLYGLITGTEAKGWLVTVLEGNEEIGQVKVDDLGNYVIEGLKPGTVDIHLSGPDSDIRLPDIDLE